MIYLASGFFCARELDVVKYLEKHFDHYQVPYFSPRLGDKNDLSTEEKLLPENAQAIYEMDKRHMDECAAMIVYLGGTQFYNYEKDKNSIALDAGALFEMGYMTAQGKPIIGIGEPNQAMNIMLARSLTAFYPSVDDFMMKIEPVLNGYKRNVSRRSTNPSQDRQRGYDSFQDYIDIINNGQKAESSE